MIAACSAWPEYNTAVSGYSGGRSMIGPAYFALKVQPEIWNRLKLARQAQILDELASAAARLGGIQQPEPDARGGDVSMTVGIQRSDPAWLGDVSMTIGIQRRAAREPTGQISLRTVSSNLAERTIAVRPWYLST
jgi:hypothetical protein